MTEVGRVSKQIRNIGVFLAVSATQRCSSRSTG